MPAKLWADWGFLAILPNVEQQLIEVQSAYADNSECMYHTTNHHYFTLLQIRKWLANK